MQYRFPEQTPGGLLGRIVGAIVGVLVMIGLFFLGITVFAAVAGLALVVFLVVAARLWWLRWKLRRQARRSGQDPRDAPRGRREQGVTLEGEYRERDE